MKKIFIIVTLLISVNMFGQTTVEDETKRLINQIGLTIGWFDSKEFSEYNISAFIIHGCHTEKHKSNVDEIETIDMMLKEKKSILSKEDFEYYSYRNSLRKQSINAVCKVFYSNDVETIKEGVYELQSIVNTINDKDYPVAVIPSYCKTVCGAYYSYWDEIRQIDIIIDSIKYKDNTISLKDITL